MQKFQYLQQADFTESIHKFWISNYYYQKIKGFNATIAGYPAVISDNITRTFHNNRLSTDYALFEKDFKLLPPDLFRTVCRYYERKRVSRNNIDNMVEHFGTLSEAKDYYYYIKNGKWIVASICITKHKRNWVGKEVSTAWVNPSYRGMGIALEIYTRIIDDGNILISGSMQTTHSQKLWRGLVKRYEESDEVSIWAHNLNKLSESQQVEWNDTEDFYDIDFEKKLYGYSSSDDWRLIIWKK